MQRYYRVKRVVFAAEKRLKPHFFYVFFGFVYFFFDVVEQAFVVFFFGKVNHLEGVVYCLLRLVESGDLVSYGRNLPCYLLALFKVLPYFWQFLFGFQFFQFFSLLVQVKESTLLLAGFVTAL